MTEQEFQELEEHILNMLVQAKGGLILQGKFFGMWTVNGQSSAGLTLSGHKWSIYGHCPCGATIDSIKRVFTGQLQCPGMPFPTPWNGVTTPPKPIPVLEAVKLIDVCAMCGREKCAAIDEYFGKCPNCRSLCRTCRSRCAEPGFCR